MMFPEFLRLVLAADGGNDYQPGARGLIVAHWFSLNAWHTGALLSLGGFALLAMMMAPDRHERAAFGLAAKPFIAWILGMVVLVLVAVGLLALFKAGIMPGRPLLAVTLFASLACGISVAGRALAARVLLEHNPLAQTALGIAVIIMTLTSPFGLVVLGLTAPMGLGALLLARRH